jgi:hypothetical protein
MNPNTVVEISKFTGLLCCTNCRSRYELKKGGMRHKAHGKDICPKCAHAPLMQRRGPLDGRIAFFNRLALAQRGQRLSYQATTTRS